MKSITKEEIVEYVEKNIHVFHERRLEKLKRLKLKDILKRKNPYLFKAKNINTAGEFIENILNAFLSSQEEGLFGGFLEGLAIFICSYIYGGRKSSTEGIDLVFEKDSVKYIISIKSGPNWGNNSQIKKMKDYFRKAKKILRTNTPSGFNVIAVNGCCYGKDNSPDKGEYLKLCGQEFWSFISGNESLYTDIIEPLGHKSKEKNEQFIEEYSKVINKFSFDFMKMFCDTEGKILWSEVVMFISKKQAKKVRKRIRKS
jgi:hypothetical protein